MPDVSICLPYYMNPGMLALHYREWAGWPDELKAQVEIVLVDDASPDGAALEVARPEGLPALSIYRATVDQPWHQDGARNLGAHVARGRWLVLTDMDHMLRQAAATRLLDRIHRGRVHGGDIYTLHRLDAASGRPIRGRWWRYKPHPNSFVLARDTYWHIGGYDEAMCGVYGTDGLFRWRAFAKARRRHLGDVALHRYGRGMISDAGTTTLPRKDGRDEAEHARRIAERKALGVDFAVPVLNFAWERQL